MGYTLRVNVRACTMQRDGSATSSNVYNASRIDTYLCERVCVLHDVIESISLQRKKTDRVGAAQ